MKSLLNLIAVLYSCSLLAQPGSFLVKGNIAGLKAPAIAYLAYRVEGKNKIDSCVVNKGGFEIRGTIKDPVHATLIIDHRGIGFYNLNPKGKNDMMKLLIDSGTLYVAGIDSASTASYTGMPLNDAFLQFQGQMKPVQDSLFGLADMIMKPSTDHLPQASRDSINALKGALQTRRTALAEQYVRNHPAAYYSLMVMRDYLSGMEPDKLIALHETLSEPVRQTNAGREMRTILNNMRNVIVGVQAPEFVEKDVDGKDVRLSEHRGKYVLIEFWASWCGPCRTENPDLVKLYDRLKGKNFTIIGVSLDKSDGREAWLKAIADDKLSWIQVSDLRGWESKVAKLYGVRSIPENFLVDPSGKIIGVGLKREELELRVKNMPTDQKL